MKIKYKVIFYQSTSLKKSFSSFSYDGMEPNQTFKRTRHESPADLPAPSPKGLPQEVTAKWLLSARFPVFLKGAGESHVVLRMCKSEK